MKSSRTGTVVYFIDFEKGYVIKPGNKGHPRYVGEYRTDWFMKIFNSLDRVPELTTTEVNNFKRILSSN